MRRRLRGKIHRRAPRRPGDAARQIRQLRAHAGAEHQERLRRPARFPKSAVDGVFQIPHALAARNCRSTNLSARPSASNWRRPTIFCCACARNCITTSTARWMCWEKICSPPSRPNLGYGDRSPSKRIEKFMRDLYTHMRNIFLITRTLEQRMALRPAAQEPAFAARLLLPRRRERRNRWTALCSSTAKSTPRPTAFSAIRRAG